MTTRDHTYPEAGPTEGFLYVREWETHKLVTEFRHCYAVLAAMAFELEFRKNHEHAEEQDDGTVLTGSGEIPPEVIVMMEAALESVESNPTVAEEVER